MTSKNYGIMKYTKQHKKPKPAHSVQYLADMFELKDLSRVTKIYDDELKKVNYTTGDGQHDENKELIRAVFLEKQLKKHSRDRYSKTACDSDYTGDTIREITRDFLKQKAKAQKTLEDLRKKMQENETPELQAQWHNCLSQEYRESCRISNMVHDYRKMFTCMQKQEQQQSAPQQPTQQNQAQAPQPVDIRTLRKQAERDLSTAKDKNLAESISSAMDDSMVQGRIQDMNVNEMTGRAYRNASSFFGAGTDELLATLKQDQSGEYKNVPLHKTLQKILDDILGQAEIRALERGFNRPSRFSHFVKGCFLPVYRSNKPRKRPAFYIDASGSMSDRRGAFNCVSSAIGVFLRTQHRRISELRPTYFAFTGADTAVKFDIMKRVPTASGGTSVRFLSNVKENENTIIITDAEFDSYDLATVRLWAQSHAKAQVNWIINDKSGANRLKTALLGLKNQKVHYTMF